jgi:hypothetical protein
MFKVGDKVKLTTNAHILFQNHTSKKPFLNKICTVNNVENRFSILEERVVTQCYITSPEGVFRGFSEEYLEPAGTKVKKKNLPEWW